MKKFAAILLVLVLSLTLAVSALAEQATFLMTTITDMDGNILVTLTEDGIVVDADGNDVSDEFPVLCLVMDDETMECAFGTEDELISGTMEIIEQTEDSVVLEFTLEDGEVLQMIYTVAEINTITYVDEENGLLFIMPELVLEDVEEAE